MLSTPLKQRTEQGWKKRFRWKLSDLVSRFLSVYLHLFCFLEVQMCNYPEGFMALPYTLPHFYLIVHLVLIDTAADAAKPEWPTQQGGSPAPSTTRASGQGTRRKCKCMMPFSGSPPESLTLSYHHNNYAHIKIKNKEMLGYFLFEILLFYLIFFYLKFLLNEFLLNGLAT